MGKAVKILFIVAGVSFLLNIAWENLQAPLYQGYSNFWQHLPICSIASLGDVLIILLLYLVLAIINKDILWVAKISKREVIILIVLGVLVAVGIEKWALTTLRWQYTSTMPLIPFVEVGLLPIFQMGILPLFTFYVSRRIITR